jgi:hypothetical protein
MDLYHDTHDVHPTIVNVYTKMVRMYTDTLAGIRSTGC